MTILVKVTKWMRGMAETQELLSKFKFNEAMEKLEETIDKTSASLSLPLQIRAKIYFENDEFYRADQIFQEYRWRYPHHVDQMDLFSTCLWQMNEKHRLSHLSENLLNNARLVIGLSYR